MLLVPILRNPLEILAEIILIKYFNITYCTTFILESNFNFSPNKFQSTVNFIHTNSSNNIEDLMSSAYDIGCSDFVVQISKPVEFLNSLAKVSQQAKRRANRKIIILPYNSDKVNGTEINKIIEHNEVKFISDILLILPERANSFNKCKIFHLAIKDFIATEPKVINLDEWDSCTEKFKRNLNLFPFDITDLKGKTLEVAAFTYKPYAIVKDDITLGSDGTEVRIVEEFCRWVNCTIKIINNEAEWGNINENGTGVGVLGDVAEDKADVALAAIYYWYDQYKFVDYSTYCLRSGVTAIVPSPRLLVSWILPLLPFEWTMWLVLVATFIFSSFAIYVALQQDSYNVFFTTFSIMILQSPREPSRRLWAFRSISGWLLVATLVIDNAYSGGLSSLFTVPLYEAPIDYIQDLVDRRMPWGATHEAWVFSIQTSEEPKMKQLVSQFTVKEPDTLEKLSFGTSMAFSIERLEGGNFAIGDYITDNVAANFRIMLQDFYYEYSTLVLRKNSPYKEKMNQLILRVHECGLFYAWEQQIALNYLNYKVQTKIRLSRTKQEANIEPLNVIRIVGIFIIYIVGVMMSTAVFIIELLISNKNKNML